MCGLTGFVDRARTADDHPEVTVREMVRTLVHRGPDDEGVWVDPSAGVALGVRRLAVVDLSIEGHQPMESASGRYVIALNGEIYNFPEMGGELEGLGWKFRGHSDTEVLLAAVDQWGLDTALRRSNGMFALALWDRKDRALHLARDRMGEKPLYYGWLRGVFAFGSELRALRAHPHFDCEVDREALELFIRYNNVPAPYSIYRGIRKLPAATILTIDQENTGSLPSPVAYWSLSQVAERGANNTYLRPVEEAVDELDSLLKSAVRNRMVADVPVGAFLSGGIDSSTLVAIMAAESRGKVKTFAIGSDDVLHNEANNAAAVANHLGTDHATLIVTPGDALALVPILPSIYDEPFADSSQIPTYLLAKLARRDVTVSLSGDGGDELFGGYNRHVASERIRNATRWWPQPFRSAVAGALSAPSAGTWDRVFRFAYSATGGSIRGSADKVQKLASLIEPSKSDGAYSRLISHWPVQTSLVLQAQHARTLLDGSASWPRLASATEQMMFLDASSYLPDDILVKVDRATMAVSLEARLPYLDPDLIDFAWRLPLGFKIRGGQGKWLLRQVLKRYVPPGLTERPKAGFSVPVAQWLRGPLRGWAESLLEPARLKNEGYFDPAPIREKWNEHISGTRNRQDAIWSVLMFQAWLEEGRRLTVPSNAA